MDDRENSRWSVDFLQSKRRETDPVADDAVTSILSGGVEREKTVQGILNLLIKNQDHIPDELPPSLKAFFHETAELPHWADPEKLRRSAEVFARFGPEIVWILFCRSLPLCYSCANGAEVLARTGRLNHPEWDKYRILNRRIMETAQFMMYVLAPGGFEPSGRAIVAIQKVRLIHAAIRHFIRERDWDEARFGEPINQEDMAGTLMSFSIAVIQGLALLHVQLSDDQKDAYMHLWRVAGHIIGVQPDLIPENVEDACILEKAILDHQIAPSEAGRELTEAVVDYLRHLLKYRFVRRFPEVLIRYLVDERTADVLGVRKRVAHWPFYLFMAIVQRMAQMEKQSRVFRWVVEKLNLDLMQALINEQNPVKGGHFYIPPSLSGSWELPR